MELPFELTDEPLFPHEVPGASDHWCTDYAPSLTKVTVTNTDIAKTRRSMSL